MRRTALALLLVVALVALTAAPGCYMFSRSRHRITPPETDVHRTTNETIPSGPADEIWEIEITPPKESEEAKP